MKNNTSTVSPQLHKNDKLSNGVETLRSVKEPYKLELFWPHIIFFTILHISSVYGAYLLFTSAKSLTALFGKYTRYSLKRHIYQNYFYRDFSIRLFRTGSYGWSTQAMGSSILQSQLSASITDSFYEYCGFSGK